MVCLKPYTGIYGSDFKINCQEKKKSHILSNKGECENLINMEI